MSSAWAALFSGGKDSSWALHRSQQTGKEVVRTVTARPRGDSYLFHTPATDITSLLSRAAGIEHHAFPVDEVDEDTTDSESAGDAELAALETALLSIDEEVTGGLDGVITGAVESRYQRDRIQQVCERYGYDCVSPLWQCDPRETLESMVSKGLDIRIVAVAADGLDESWLGRSIDTQALDDLFALVDSKRLHPMGEGGEYETIVVDGPHLTQTLQFDATTQWDGVRGHLIIENAWLSPNSHHS